MVVVKNKFIFHVIYFRAVGYIPFTKPIPVQCIVFDINMHPFLWPVVRYLLNRIPHSITNHITQGQDPIGIKILTVDIRMPRPGMCVLGTWNCNGTHCASMLHTLYKHCCEISMIHWIFFRCKFILFFRFKIYLCALSGDGLRMPKHVAVNEEYFVLCMSCCTGVGYVNGGKFIICLFKKLLNIQSLLAFYAMSTGSCSYSRGVTSQKTWMFIKTAGITSHLTGIYFRTGHWLIYVFHDI